MKQIISSYKCLGVFTSPKVVQYWRATLGIGQVQSLPTEGVAYLEINYSGNLRLYLREGYETEPYPCELAQQLRGFFGIPCEHQDLLTVALSAPDERVEHLFDSRGIRSWFETEAIEDEEEEEIRGVAIYDPVNRPGPNKKSRLRVNAGARFSSLFGPTRFTPGFFQNNTSGNDLPSYNAAVARSTQNAIGRPAEPRTFTKALTLPSLNKALRELNFVQTGATVVGTPASSLSLLNRVRGFAQRDSDVGEMMVCFFHA